MIRTENGTTQVQGTTHELLLDMIMVVRAVGHTLKESVIEGKEHEAFYTLGKILIDAITDTYAGRDDGMEEVTPDDIDISGIFGGQEDD